MILDELAEYATQRVKADMEKKPLDVMKFEALGSGKGYFRFEKTLARGKAVIAEVKRASPSKGMISEDFPYVDIAREYENSGADCISCLTEPKWFLGSDEIFREIRRSVSLPMLRKDFTVHEYQIYQAKAMGADAVLLICALLDVQKLKRYIGICDELGISALVETHNESEITAAVEAGARVIGVNNRDLRDFSVNTENAAGLRSRVPQGKIFVSESGITSPETAAEMFRNGADAVLIGEALMRSSDKNRFINMCKIPTCFEGAVK